MLHEKDIVAGRQLPSEFRSDMAKHCLRMTDRHNAIGAIMERDDIKSLRRELRCTSRELAHALGVEAKLVLAWEDEQAFPTKRNIEAMNKLRETFSDYPEEETRAILGTNAFQVYDFDRDQLMPIAEKIGPELADIQKAA